MAHRTGSFSQECFKQQQRKRTRVKTNEAKIMRMAENHICLCELFFFFFTARCNVSDDNIFKTLFLLFLNHGSVADILNLTKLDKASMEKMRNVTPGIPVNVLVIACDL